MYCKKIAQLLSEQQDHKLSLSQKLMMKFHLSMCVFCRRMAVQIAFIQRVTKRMGGIADESPVAHPEIFSASLSPDAKARMKNILTDRDFQ